MSLIAKKWSSYIEIPFSQDAFKFMTTFMAPAIHRTYYHNLVIG